MRCCSWLLRSGWSPRFHLNTSLKLDIGLAALLVGPNGLTVMWLYRALGVEGILGSAALIVWFVCSVLHQLPGDMSKRLKSKNSLGLIPGWTSLRLLPARSITGSFIVMASIMAIQQRMSTRTGKRYLGVMPEDSETHFGIRSDFAQSWCWTALTHYRLGSKGTRRVGMTDTQAATVWQLSVPYMTLLNIAMSMPSVTSGGSGISVRQFAIIQQTPMQGSSPESRMLICSQPHRHRRQGEWTSQGFL